MEITLIRHGRSAQIENHRMNSKEYKKWVEAYNHLGIVEGESCSKDAIEKGATSSILLTSDLRRAIESARTLNPSAKIQSDPLFREMELPMPDINFPGVRLRPNTWAVLLRLLWICGYSQGCESYSEAKYRAKRASLKLTSFAKEHQHAVLIGHGFFNLYIAKELQKSGWTGKRRTGSKHWNAVTYTI
ncbi:phosphoglycerate mutase [Cytobacillus firmus]|uniref:histidine phosphatase family protein n=1 Tax=Cytobacillus firmus TaxID=1399 RepID=UPI00077C9A89|nr:histidine phosphatase family protein [Cytobacillus firmus]MBG9544320.1 phosphoglycerate mutase [Cytobacillus firmus]MBG9553277.1 phosphoglycerate mutase [Cytobacillus firmus]MBG9575074.1 phosphoglycerate mutase [Cytobacillus firmus]MEC1894416.1 histidine phosphatase family protein [Cytobacillus firmus]MED4448604.1 histidine phosphatase family protein [Cytobacillus firmus]